MGRFGSFSPALARRTALVTASTASSWPITFSFMKLSICSNRCDSSAAILDKGTPVHWEITSRISSSPTDGLSFDCSSENSFSRLSSSISNLCSLCLSSLAWSYSWSVDAASFSRRNSSKLVRTSRRDGGTAYLRILTRAEASSIRSIALSGKNLSDT